jgi:hypothetical protein
MNLTDYHVKYFADELKLTKHCSSDSLEKLAGTFAGAKVDLNNAESVERGNGKSVNTGLANVGLGK